MKSIILAVVACAWASTGCQPPSPSTPQPESSVPSRSAPPHTAKRCFGSPAPHAPHSLPPLSAPPEKLQGPIHEVRVEVAGNLDPSLVRGLISTKPGDDADRTKIRADLKRTFALGNFEDVALQASRSPQGWILTYIVRERPVLTHVRWRGVSPDQRAEIESVAGQHEGDLFAPAAVHRAEQAARDHLLQRGHAHARVETFVRRPDERSAQLCIDVHAGPRVRVQAVHFDGRAKLAAEQLHSAMRNAGSQDNLPGGLLRLDLLDTQLLHVTARYYDAGMLEVRLGEPEIRYSDDRSAAAIHVTLHEGPVYRIGTVSFDGALAAHAMKYRSVLDLRTGEVFDRSGVMAAIEKLNALRASEGLSGTVAPATELHPQAGTVDLTFALE